MSPQSSFTQELSLDLAGVGYSAIAAADYDGDGRLDVVLTGRDANGVAIARLYRNTEQGFTKDTTVTLPGVYNGSLSWGDYNSDQRPDLLLTGLDATNTRITRLFQNTETGFIEDTSIALPGVTRGSAVWADYTGDGKLDFVVTGLGANGVKLTTLYQNTGNGFAEDLSVNMPGLSDSAATWGDYSGDGKPDLLLMGVGTSAITKLYRNTAEGLVEDTTVTLPGVRNGAAAWADYTGDGRLDLVLTGRTATNEPIAKLYRNTAEGLVEDTTVTLPGVYYSAVAWADYNNDGKPDLFLSGMSVTGTAIAKLYRNTGSGFEPDFSVELPGVSLGGVTWADYSGDGSPDLLLTGLSNTGEAIAQLYTNTFVPPVQVSLTTDAPPVVNQPFAVTLRLSAPVPGITEESLQITNGAIGDWQTSDNQTFTFTVTPFDQDEVVITLPAERVGNVAEARLTRLFDSLAPAVPTFDTSIELTANNQLLLTGTAEVNSRVRVTLEDGTEIGTAVANSSGVWSLLPTSALSDGFRTLTATATDEASNVSDFSVGYNLVVDTQAPNAPEIEPIQASSGAQPTIKGTAEANSRIHLTLNELQIDTITANASGDWQYTASLADGSYTITAIAIDAAGNRSEISTDTLIVDTQTPTAPVITGNVANGGRMGGAKLLLSGTTDPQSTVQLFAGNEKIGEATTDATTGAWRYSFAQNPLFDGQYTFTAVVVDVAGNTSPQSADFVVTIDNQGPIITLDSSSADVLNGSFTVTVAVEDSIAVLNPNQFTLSNGTLSNFTAIDNAHYSFEVTPIQEGQVTIDIAQGAVQDDATNESSAIQLVRIYDATPPASPSITNASSVTNNRKPTLTGTAEAHARIQILQNGQPIGVSTATAEGEWRYEVEADLADGTYTFAATTLDAAGNISTPSNPFALTIDTSTPDSPVFASPADVANTPNPIFTGTALAGSTIQVTAGDRVLGEAIANDQGVWSLTATSSLADGIYSITATARNRAGTLSAATSPFVLRVDSTAPTVSFSTIAPDPRTTPIDRLTVTFSEAISSFELSDLQLTRDGVAIALTGATLNAANAKTFSLNGLDSLTATPGTYRLRLVAQPSGITDQAENRLSQDQQVQWILARSPSEPVDPTPQEPPKQPIFDQVSGRFVLTAALLSLGDDWQSVDTSAFVPKAGNANARMLKGTNGNDLLRGHPKANRLLGGKGHDILSGDEGNDILSGDAGNDLLLGGAGNDTLIGGSGDDVLFGGAGKNTCTGGKGKDSFVFGQPGEYSTITDFGRGDRLVILGRQFGGLSTGVLSKDLFRLGSVAKTAGDRFLYNQETGELFFDVDGRGGKRAIELAQLQPNTSLNSKSILIL